MQKPDQSWDAFARMSIQGLLSLGAQPEFPVHEMHDWICRTTLKQNLEADRACAEYWKTGLWPKMSDEVRMLAVLRHLYVASFVFFAWQKGKPIVPAESPEEYILSGLKGGWYMEWDRWAVSYLNDRKLYPFDLWSSN